MPEVEWVWADDLGNLTTDDIFHRPFQFALSPEVLRGLGRRLVVTHFDQILYRMGSYSATPEGWQQYRRAVEEGFRFADMVTFPSRYVMDEVLQLKLIDSSRARVVHLGTDEDPRREDQPVPPPYAGHVRAPVLLCIGTDYEHKNRPFALEVALELRRRHEWSGTIVLAGSRLNHGSTRAAEEELLVRYPGLASQTLTLGPVSQGEKAWLMDQAAAVLYPSRDEGFGLVPFEAAAAGLPCIFAACASMAELLPQEAATIVQWDAEATAARVATILASQPEREALIAAVRAAGGSMTWRATAEEYSRIYHAVADSPN